MITDIVFCLLGKIFLSMAKNREKNKKKMHFYGHFSGYFESLSKLNNYFTVVKTFKNLLNFFVNQVIVFLLKELALTKKNRLKKEINAFFHSLSCLFCSFLFLFECFWDSKHLDIIFLLPEMLFVFNSTHFRYLNFFLPKDFKYFSRKTAISGFHEMFLEFNSTH